MYHSLMQLPSALVATGPRQMSNLKKCQRTAWCLAHGLCRAIADVVSVPCTSRPGGISCCMPPAAYVHECLMGAECGAVPAHCLRPRVSPLIIDELRRCATLPWLVALTRASLHRAWPGPTQVCWRSMDQCIALSRAPSAAWVHGERAPFTAAAAMHARPPCLYNTTRSPSLPASLPARPPSPLLIRPNIVLSNFSPLNHAGVTHVRMTTAPLP
jgi:hypothetical protein